MTDSASTPRLRITFAIYLALIAVSAVVGPREIAGWQYYAMSLAGFVCVCLGCLGRVWCSVFIAGHKDADLVTTGPYARCRHPLYSCSILGALGLGLATKSWLLCLITVLMITALVVYAATCEEQFLADSFPEQYGAYVASTPNMWWPRGARALPEHVDLRPAVFWKAFLDAGSFFLLWLLVAVAAEFRLAA
jgi:protein-S-isoprenylcysteine O-methyltransferase Ste14